MLWVKSLHIIFMVTWFAGLFYLPRLFVYHATAEDRISIERFKLMERRLFWGIMTPGAVLTIVFGVWLWLGWFRRPPAGSTPRSRWSRSSPATTSGAGDCCATSPPSATRAEPRWFRWFNEVPTLVLFATVFLVVFKPF